MAGIKNKLNGKWIRTCSAITRDSVRVRVPRAFLSTLTLFFHHVSDAMAGDDRPDHGLAMMRQGRDYYRIPFYCLCGRLRGAEKRMNVADHRNALHVFHQYHDLLAERERQFKIRTKRRCQSIFLLYEKIRTYNLRYRDKQGSFKPVRFVSYIWKAVDGHILAYLKKELEKEKRQQSLDWERLDLEL